jgi:hypothetical protein
MNAMLKTALASINVPSILEPPGLFRTDGKRVDGVTVTPWRSGRPLAWDFTCCDTFAPTYLSLAASGAGMVANQAESRKRALYQDIESTHDFVPITIETSGVFGNGAQEFLKSLGHRLRTVSQDLSLNILIQQISVCIQKFNAVSILGTSTL